MDFLKNAQQIANKINKNKKQRKEYLAKMDELSDLHPENEELSDAIKLLRRAIKK